MKSVLALRHVPHEPMGLLETVLDAAGLDWQYLDLFARAPSRLEPEQLAGLIVLGGPMNVDQTDLYPFLRPEVDWIRQALDAQVPLMGICLGAQLLAKALGAKVYAMPVKEIGWYQLELTPQAADDALFRVGWDAAEPTADANGPRRITVFQWHGDTFDLPPGAVHLGRSETCQHQAFRYGASAYGLQFHVEMTREMIDDWLGEPGNSGELAVLDYIDPEEIRRQSPKQLPLMQAVGRGMLSRFAAMCRARA